MNSYKVLVINPGSTSTKLALYENNHCITSTNVFHDSSVLMKFPHINDQLLYRLHVIQEFIESNQIDCSDLDAVMARGGGCVSVESGIYEVNRKMLADTKKAKGNLYHVSMLGVQLGAECQKMYGGRLLTMDPPVVDEYQDLARITGISGVYRTAISHALNLKATIKDHCHRVGKDYEKTNWIVCHIDGGISITAHRRGRMIDGNDAGGGQGPFTPTRMGSMAVTDLLRLLKEKSLEEIQNDCYESGGLSSHFKTSNADVIHRMVEKKDPKATLIWQAMIYQIAKEIGAMSVVLKGDVDGIVCTGGLLRFSDIEQGIKDQCEWIAEVTCYPGELEMDVLAQGAYDVLTKKKQPKEYTGIPVWNEFDF